MVTKNIVKQPKSIVEVTVTVPWADMSSKWDETLQRLAADIELPGFRKGLAPLPMVEQNLGNKLPDEVLKVVMPQTLIEALQGSDIVPIDYPKYQILSFVKGQQLQFKAVLTERPQVTVGDYKNIKGSRPSQKIVTDEDVTKLVDELFKRWKVRQPSPQNVSSQPAATPTPNGPAGSISFGQNDTGTGIVNAQGNPVTSQTDSNVPDDNFAKAVGAQSLNDLKTKIKADLESEAKNNNELDYEESILQEVEKITAVEIPDVLVEDELNRMMVSMQRRVSEMGLLLEDYLKNQVDAGHPNGRTAEDLRSEWKDQAERNVKMELGLAEIAKKENVVISDEEVQAEVDKIPDARIKQQFESQEPRLHLKHSLRQIRTLELLKGLVKTA